MNSDISRDRLDAIDPLDTQLRRLPATPAGREGRSRPALGLSPFPLAGLALLALGVGLGPHGLNILSRSVLSYLDPAVSLAIAALGTLVGLGLNVRQLREARLLGASSFEAALTMLVVGVGILTLSRVQHPLEPWLFALLLGTCAASSATTAETSADERRISAARIGDLDDVFPIVAGGLLLAVLRNVSLASATSLVLMVIVIALAIALAGWLLVAQTTLESEQHVFVAGTLLLIGGAAAYLSQSALFGGLVTGLFWNLAGGPARERISQDIRYFQHPLLVLLLLVAGARILPSVNTVIVGMAYLVCRTAAKLGGGRLARRIVEGGSSEEFGFILLAPGLTGIAFALNALQVSSAADWALSLLAIVVTGSIGSELLSWSFRPRERRS
jgi:cytochrome bd-type quinol oxidase subunit 2